MTRNDCEQAIKIKLREIHDIAVEYMGREPEYLTMFTIDGYMHINNTYWDDDADKPIDAGGEINEAS